MRHPRLRGRRVRRRVPAPAIVVGSIAAFALVVGGAFASGLGGPCGYLICLNDIGPGQVDARVVRDRSLTSAKLSPSLVRDLRDQTDFNAVTYVEASKAIPAAQLTLVVAQCPSGMQAIGGGGVQTNKGSASWINDTYPSTPDGAAGDDAWSVVWGSPADAASTVTVYAICVPR